jgi:thiamine-phosphate pyrophosphorylase
MQGELANHYFVNTSSSNDPSLWEQAELYGVVDLDYHLSAETAAVAAERLLEGGVDILQLRAKRLPPSVVAGLAGEILAMTTPLGVPLIIEGFPELLREVPAAGLHLGHESISIEDARASAGRPIVVGKDTHNMAEALSAAEAGADYIGFGPLFDNPNKPGLPAIG